MRESVGVGERGGLEEVFLRFQKKMLCSLIEKGVKTYTFGEVQSRFVIEVEDVRNLSYNMDIY